MSKSRITRLLFSITKQTASRSINTDTPKPNRKMVTSASRNSSTNSTNPNLQSWHPSRPRRFAPLNPDKPSTTAPKLSGIIFDVDGTLCLPQNYMFREMRAALEIDKSTDILDHIRGLSTDIDQDESSPQSRAHAAIRAIERNAMSSQQPQPGLVELMTFLERRKVPKALCTRNFPAPVQHLIDTFLADLEKGFDMVVTRETVGLAPKPSPEGLWAIAKCWGLDTSEGSAVLSEEGDLLERARKQLGSQIIMVGDSIDDMAAGYRAGAATVLLVNDENEWLVGHDFVDASIGRLDELVQMLDDGFVGRKEV